MSIDAPKTRRIVEVGDFSHGVDSYVPPLKGQPGYLRWMTDCVTKGNLIQTRPGYRTLLSFDVTDPDQPFKAWWDAEDRPILVPQGMTIFTTNGGAQVCVFAVSGSVWQAAVNSNGKLAAATQITGLRFSRIATQIVFAAPIQSATIVDGVVRVLSRPNNLLLMQDGVTRCGWFDGQSSGHYNPEKRVVVDSGGSTLYPAGFNETRIGQWMAWSGNRLFVANGSQVFASDLNDPSHFTEELILTSVPVINFPDAITGMIDRGTSGTSNSILIVFTRSMTWAIYSGVQARLPDATYGYPGWQGTNNFRSIVFNGTGCVAGKSPVNHRGLLYWLSSGGIVVFDSISTVNSTQSIPPIDYEEAYSKQLCAQDLAGACGGINDSYLFFAMPVGPVTNGAVQNGHIQVLDRQITVDHAIGLYGPTTYARAGWQGVWTGIRPVEFSTAAINGIDRTYAFSMDNDGTPRIWEMMQGNRADNGLPITWTFETQQHQMGQSAFDTANFLFFRTFLAGVLGNVQMQGFWKGTRGIYKRILNTFMTATPGTILAPTPEYSPVKFGTVNTSSAPQVRSIRSQNVRGPQADDCQSSAVEDRGRNPDDRDRAFSLFFIMRGRCAVEFYRLEADDTPNTTEGRVEGDESGFNLLKGAGCPQHIDGVTPDYVLAEDTPRNALVAVSSNQLFASGDHAAPNGVPLPSPLPPAPPPPPVPPVDCPSVVADAIITSLAEGSNECTKAAALANARSGAIASDGVALVSILTGQLEMTGACPSYSIRFSFREIQPTTTVDFSDSVLVPGNTYKICWKVVTDKVQGGFTPVVTQSGAHTFVAATNNDVITFATLSIDMTVDSLVALFDETAFPGASWRKTAQLTLICDGSACP